MLTKAIPVLPSTNITKAICFYETRLGFKGLNYGNYGTLKYKNVEIHLCLITVKSANLFAGCFIQVDNIEDLYTEYCAKGLIHLKGKLADRPAGLKEFVLKDEDNNILRFGEKR